MEEITEITNIEQAGKSIGYQDQQGEFVELESKTLVSMNIWGFQPGLFERLQNDFALFLKKNIQNIKAEFLLPVVINKMVRSKEASVKMLDTDFGWFGVTYQADRPATVEKINMLIKNGDYPERLWK
jgi:hypothetical protein